MKGDPQASADRRSALDSGQKRRNAQGEMQLSVRPSTPLREVAGLLEKHRIKRVPVLQAGRLVGIVSRADLVRRLAEIQTRA
jgi:predicted transcriptional regulator